MTSLRALFRDHRALAVLLLAMALAVRALMPPGMMAGTASASGEKRFTIQLCTAGLDRHTAQIVLPLEKPSRPDAPQHDGKADQHCAFSSLAMGALDGAGGPVPVLALRPAPPRAFTPAATAEPAAHPYLRPPLRGPPILG